MHVVECKDATDFLEACNIYIQSHPLESSILVSFCQSIIQGIRDYPKQTWLVVKCEDGHVVAPSFNCHLPHNVILFPIPHEYRQEVIQLLVDAYDPVTVAGAQGPLVETTLFKNKFSQPLKMTHESIYYQLTFFKPATWENGHVRLATDSDVDCVFDWIQHFTREAHIPSISKLEILNRISTKSILLYILNDEPVSMAGHAAILPNYPIVRLGSVFTPSKHRGKGYAKFAVTGIIQHLLKLDNYTITLFADKANPAAINLYEKIGFVKHSENVEFSM
jgi:RimJ/RimL family protein N-acetyltransferase